MSFFRGGQTRLSACVRVCEGGKCVVSSSTSAPCQRLHSNSSSSSRDHTEICCCCLSRCCGFARRRISPLSQQPRRNALLDPPPFLASLMCAGYFRNKEAKNHIFLSSFKSNFLIFPSILINLALPFITHSLLIRVRCVCVCVCALHYTHTRTC